MRRASLAALTLAASGGMLAAQEDQEPALTGPTLTATISQSAVVDTNYNLDDPSPGTSYYGDTRLVLGYLSETGTQSLSLGLDTGMRALWEAEESFDLTFASPTTADVGYIRDWADSRFDATLRYRQTEVNFDPTFDDVVGDPGSLPDDLDEIEGDAIERRLDANIGLALRTDAPSSYAFRLRGTNVDYSEEQDDLTPRASVLGEALWTLRLTPVLSSAVLGNYFYYTADDGPETELWVAEIDGGFIYEPSENLSIAAGIGYADRQREETIGGVRERTEDNSGATVRAAVDYLMRYGTVSFNGRVTDAAPETRFIGDLRGTYDLTRGDLFARIFQDYTADNEGDEVQVRGAGFGVTREINTVSEIGLDFAVAEQVNQDDPDDPDINRVDLTAIYSYELTPVVEASLGYQMSKFEEDPDDAISHAFFVEIGRTFATRPY